MTTTIKTPAGLTITPEMIEAITNQLGRARSATLFFGGADTRASLYEQLDDVSDSIAKQDWHLASSRAMVAANLTRTCPDWKSHDTQHALAELLVLVAQLNDIVTRERLASYLKH